MSAFTWLRRPRRPPSPPKSSPACPGPPGRLRHDTPSSFVPASPRGVTVTAAGSALHLLRRGLAAALLALPLLAAIAPQAGAEAALQGLQYDRLFFPENTARRVAACDAAGAGPAFALTGPDARLFELAGGVLRFRVRDRRRYLPDFENPRDKDRDNRYQVAVAAPDRTLCRFVITITDRDEPGRVFLPAAYAVQGEPLTARLSDPDAPLAVSAWRWQRSSGPDAFTDIEGADGARYTPAAGDTGRLLRVVAHYRDRHGAAQRARHTMSHPVTGPRLGRLEARTGASPSGELHPPFDPRISHYAVECAERETLEVSWSAPPGVRVDVNGVQRRPGRSATARVAVSDTADVAVTASAADGGFTRYVLHCAPPNLARIITRPSAERPLGSLLTLTSTAYAAVIDENGVPRRHRRIVDPTGLIQSAGFFLMPFGAGEARRWAHAAPRETVGHLPSVSRAANGGTWIVFDAGLDPLFTVNTDLPLTRTGKHDFRLLEDGSMLMMAYEPAVRDFSFLSRGAPSDGAPYRAGSALLNNQGEPWGRAVETRDSAIQIVGPDGAARWTWNSWGRMPLEDCVQHRFPDDYAHVNSLQMTARGVLASFRGCSSVMMIDPGAPVGDEIVWRLGQSNLAPGDWAASGYGPAPMDLIGDPEGAFCGQHAATLLDEGHGEARLLLFDNGVACVANPATGEPLTRAGEDFSRAVEYALDFEHGEAVFVRDRFLGGKPDVLGAVGGHVAPADDGGWLVSWGRRRTGPSGAKQAVSLVDPATGRESFSISREGMLIAQNEFRALPVPAAALERAREPLAGFVSEPLRRTAGPDGTAGTHELAVAFSRPVADFGADTPSIEVAGGKLVSVEHRRGFGRPAYEYVLRVAAKSASGVKVRLVEGVGCANKGICTASGERLSGARQPPIPDHYHSERKTEN